MTDKLIYIMLFFNVLIVFILIFGKKEDSNSRRIENQINSILKGQEVFERALREELSVSRAENSRNSKQDRQETNNTLRMFNDSLVVQMKAVSDIQRNQLETFSRQLAVLSDKVEEKLKSIQQDNNKKLEEMRATVDEKLHNTLEKRLGESFKSISERLEALYREIGEMQSLADGVNDLRKALTNVKTRGTWGEIQLGNIIEQILVSEQYAVNIPTKKNSTERVEFAVKLPGQNDNPNSHVWLPIDAKFPQEDYQKLVDALEEGDKDSAEEYSRQLEQRIKAEAKDIREKYIDPPNTTDFGILFLPTESLYAEVIRRPGLWETLQRDYKVVLTGPTTLAALLNSLQMGFRTLAIEKRSSEVWTLLGAVKTEFGRFGDILEKTQKKLQEASNTIDNAARKSRTIERKLKHVQELPAVEASTVLSDYSEESYEEVL